MRTGSAVVVLPRDENKAEAEAEVALLPPSPLLFSFDGIKILFSNRFFETVVVVVVVRIIFVCIIALLLISTQRRLKKIALSSLFLLRTKNPDRETETENQRERGRRCGAKSRETSFFFSAAVCSVFFFDFFDFFFGFFFSWKLRKSHITTRVTNITRRRRRSERHS